MALLSRDTSVKTYLASKFNSNMIISSSEGSICFLHLDIARMPNTACQKAHVTKKSKWVVSKVNVLLTLKNGYDRLHMRNRDFLKMLKVNGKRNPQQRKGFTPDHPPVTKHRLPGRLQINNRIDEYHGGEFASNCQQRGNFTRMLRHSTCRGPILHPFSGIRNILATDHR
jgi:hypothetical protein